MDIQRPDIHLRVVIRTVTPVAIEETVYDMLGMEIFLIGSDHGGEPWTFGGCSIGSHGNP
jgi:hypothetical protein